MLEEQLAGLSEEKKEIIEAFIFAYNTDKLFINFGVHRITGEKCAFVSFVEEKDDGSYFVPLAMLYPDNRVAFKDYKFDFEEVEEPEFKIGERVDSTPSRGIVERVRDFILRR